MVRVLVPEVVHAWRLPTPWISIALLLTTQRVAPETPIPQGPCKGSVPFSPKKVPKLKLGVPDEPEGTVGEVGFFRFLPQPKGNKPPAKTIKTMTIQAQVCLIFFLSLNRLPRIENQFFTAKTRKNFMEGVSQKKSPG
jgi:hypothetical protein